MTERKQLEGGIAALESQRAVLGDADERRARWSRGQSNDARIDLGPLSARSSQELIESLLRRLAPEVGLQLCRDVGAAKLIVHFLLELAELANARGAAATALDFVAEGLRIAREISHRELEACLSVVQGDAQSMLGRPTDAADSYRCALGMYRELAGVKVPLEAFAGLARATSALGDVDEGLVYVARVEAGIEAGYDANAAPSLLWSCHTVLVAAGAPRANEVLTRAHSLLTERAKLLDEVDRATFLDNVPSHRAIMNACAASTTIGSAPRRTP